MCPCRCKNQQDNSNFVRVTFKETFFSTDPVFRYSVVLPKKLKKKMVPVFDSTSIQKPVFVADATYIRI